MSATLLPKGPGSRRMSDESNNQTAGAPVSGHILVICGLGGSSAVIHKAVGAAKRVIVLDAVHDTSSELRRHLAGLNFEIACTDIWQDMLARGTAKPEKVAMSIVDYTGSDMFRHLIDSGERVVLLLPASRHVRGAPPILEIIQAG